MNIPGENEMDRSIRSLAGQDAEQEDLPFLGLSDGEEEDSTCLDCGWSGTGGHGCEGVPGGFPDDEEEDRSFDSDTAAGYEGQGSD